MSAKLQSMILPAPEAWEAWGASANGTAPHVLATPAEADGVIEVLGIPARYLLALPLWLLGVDPALIPDMIRLQLEKRGLLAGGAAFRWKTVATSDNRTLVLACVLSSKLPEEVCLENAKRFEPAPALRRLPPGRLVLARESRRLVAACARGPNLAAFQVLGDNQLTADTITEIQAFLLQLAQERVLSDCAGITCWHPIPEAELAALANRTALPVEITPAPQPTPPTESWEFTPPPVEAARAARARKRGRRNLLSIFAAVYLLLVAAVAGHFAWLSYQAGQLRQTVATAAPAVGEIKATADRWRTLETAMDPALFPVERLYRAALLLPEDGVRFTLFEQRGTTFLIRGEAANAPAAFQYRDRLNADPAWAGFTWQMPQPRLLPNNSAQFQLEGTRTHAHTDPE